MLNHIISTVYFYKGKIYFIDSVRASCMYEEHIVRGFSRKRNREDQFSWVLEEVISFD